MVKMSARTVLHLFAAVHFWFGCYYDWYHVIIPQDVRRMGASDVSFVFTGKLKFLTFWDALIQGLFFTICLINDLIGTNDVSPKKTPLVRKVKDLLLPCLAFPLSMFVGVTFWGLYFVDRELVFPKVLDAFFPVWLNHVMHTNIMLFIFLELYTSFRRYPSRKLGLSVLTIFSVTYLVWIHIIHSKTGIWVYPVLEVLNLPSRIVFFAVSLVLQIGLYLFGEKLNNLVWKKQLVSHKKNEKKRRD